MPAMPTVPAVAAVLAAVGGLGLAVALVPLRARGVVVLVAGLGYGPLFAFASVAYLLSLGWIQLLLPRIRAVARTRAATPMSH